MVQPPHTTVTRRRRSRPPELQTGGSSATYGPTLPHMSDRQPEEGQREQGQPGEGRPVEGRPVAHYKPPGWFTMHVFNRVVALATRLGLSVWGSRVLRVRGRKSGQWRSVPVNLLVLGHERYLVAPRGETQWVRNIRVTGSGELVLGNKTEAIGVTEVPDAEKPQDPPRLSEALEGGSGSLLRRRERRLERAGAAKDRPAASRVQDRPAAGLSRERRCPDGRLRLRCRSSTRPDRHAGTPWASR